MCFESIITKINSFIYLKCCVEHFDKKSDGDTVTFVHESIITPPFIFMQMSSREFHEDMDMLLNMEMKLLLLDLEDVRIPEVPPPIPREPDNYNFYYRDE